MGQFTVRTYKQTKERMQNRIVARSNLTDLTDTASTSHVVSAAAREFDDVYFQMKNLQKLWDLSKAAGPDLEERSKEMNPALISRRGKITATGSVRFSRTGTTGDVSIATGTEVQVPQQGSTAPIKYKTTEEGTIANGNTQSGLVDIVALEGGTAHNVDPDTITSFGSKPSGVDYVTNPAAVTNGRGKETDDEFRTRISNYIASLSRATNTSLVYAALTAVDSASGKQVVFAHSYEDPTNLGNVTLYIDDGSGTAEDTESLTGQTVVASASGGEVDLYLQHKPIKIEAAFEVRRNGSPLTYNVDYTFEPASGHVKLTQASFPNGLTAGDTVVADYTRFTGLIEECQKIIDGDPTDRVNYPGYRAGGVRVRVLSPSIINLSLSANITVLAGYAHTTVATAVKAAVSQYVNGLTISEDVVLNEIRERCMGVPGMYDMVISNPSSNRVIRDDQVARISTANMVIS